MTAGRIDADYDVRLTDRVREWERKHPEEAAALRITVQARMGLHRPPSGPVSQLALEMQFRDAVRELKQWPTKRQWLRGET